MPRTNTPLLASSQNITTHDSYANSYCLLARGGVETRVLCVYSRMSVVPYYSNFPFWEFAAVGRFRLATALNMVAVISFVCALMMVFESPSDSTVAFDVSPTPPHPERHSLSCLERRRCSRSHSCRQTGSLLHFRLDVCTDLQ